MQTYVVLLTFTEKGSKELHKTTSRADAFKIMAAKKGINVIQTFWLAGQYDVMHIIEVEDNNKAMVHSLSLLALGNVRTQTFRAFSKDELDDLLKETFNAYDLLRAED